MFAKFKVSAPSRAAAVAVVLVALIAGAMPSFAAKPAPSSAQATFVDYAQCANGAPPSTSPACPGGWLQGVLQANNSHYSEDEVTPQRAQVVVPAGSKATGRTLTFSYQTRKATTHAYDSLATWNYTQTAADRCQGLAPADCVGGAATTFPVPLDPTPVGPAGAGKSLVTSAHQLPGQVFTMYGGTITAASTPVHDNAAGTGDDYATITITYSVSDTKVARKVQLLFGGHIAASFGPRGWGAGFGAGNINGGPYHIKWSGADGASIGNRDNQLMGSAVIPPPSLTVTKTADNATVSSGENIGFTVSVTNNGEGTAKNVTLSDPLPAGTGIDWSISPAYAGPGTCTIAGTPPTETLNCAFGDLAPSASVSVHVVSATTSATSGTFENTATAKADNNPPVTGTDSVQVLQPNLSVLKVADDATASSGDDIGFTVTVSNGGPGVAENVTLSDPLPAGTGIDWSISPAYTGPGTCSITTAGTPPVQTLNCAFGDLAASASVSVHILSATTSATSGRFDNTATAKADNNPPVTGTASVTVDKPALSVKKTADNTRVDSGENIGFTMTVSNAGPGTATNVTLSDPLPGGTGINWSISPDYAGPGTCSITTAGDPPVQTLNCAFGDLAAAASASVHVLSATTNDTSGTFDNTATAKADNAPSVEAKASIVVDKPNPTITKVADETTVSSGDNIGFTVTVSNAGPGTANNVKLSDPLPGGAGINWSISPAYAGPGTCSITTAGDPPVQTLNCAFGNLAAGDSASVHVLSATTSATSGTFDNTATATSDNTPPFDDSASVEVLEPTLTVAKKADNATVSSGDKIGFTVTVSNGGPGVARSVTLSDPLPGGTGISWSISPDYAGPGTCSITTAGVPTVQTLNCVFGDLAAGASASVHISSATNGDTTGEFKNTATAKADNAPETTGTDTIIVNRPSLGITKTADKATVSSGDDIGFTVTVNNAGPGVARNVTLSDPLPGGTGIDWSIDPAYTGPGTCSITTAGDPPVQTLNCAFGDLAAGASVGVHVSSATTSATSGTFDNTATAKADNAPPKEATASITVDKPNLSILKSADNATVDSGNPISFTITVSNTGTGAARDVTVDDNLPGTAGLDWSIDPAYDGQGTCAITGALGSETLHCDLGDVVGGTALTIHVSSPTTAGVTCGPIDNTATIAAANTGAVPSSAATVTVKCAELVVSKNPCPTTVAPGGTLGYTISYSNDGDAVAQSAVLVDTVPAGTTVVDNGGGTVAPSGATVTWQLGDLAPGTAGTRTFSVFVPESKNGSTLYNTVTLSSVSAPTASYTDGGTAVTNEGATAGGRAFGVSASVLGGTWEQEPTPDTDVENQNPGQVETVDVPPDSTDPVVHADLVKVINSPVISAGSARDDAMATTAAVAIDVLGISVTADSVVASSKSYADSTSASSTRAGSTVKNLVIKDGSTTRNYETVTGPITVLVNNQTTGVSGKVLVLETTPTGAAAGVKQPQSGFKSGLTVNAIRVVLDDNPLTELGVNESTDVIVAHAESSATFPSGLPCDATVPQVRGDAYILDTPNIALHTENIATEVGPAVSKAVLVTLPVTGNFPGTKGEDATLNTGDLSPLGTATSGTTHTDGTLSPLRANSSALVNGLNLAGGVITATTVKATSTTAAGTSTGTTTIEDLVIAGINVCSELGLDTSCSPAKNTVLVLEGTASIIVLNEQLNQNGLRVNAIHIYVIGEGNPFKLPRGAEIVISSAYSGTTS